MNSKSTFSNIIWRFFERCGAQIVTFVVSLILARLLDPEVYGIVAIITVIISVLQVFLDGGFGIALIRKKDADDLDFSSVFYFNIVFGIGFYILLFVFSPLFAKFFNMPDLTLLIRVLGLNLIFFSFKSVQQAYVSRNLLFKNFFFATLGGTIGAAFVGIFLALKGFGVWALVFQHIFNTFVDTVILWIMVKWRPKKAFSFARLKALLGFGWKILVSSLIDVIYPKLRQIIIGKMYSASNLAFYNKGETFPYTFAETINTSVDSVLLPSLSNHQENSATVKSMTKRAIKISTYIVMPIMTGLAVCAVPLVRLVLTDKWLPCVPYLRIFCISYSFYTMDISNLSAVKALGRGDLFLKLEISKRIVGVLILVSTIWWGPMVMALSSLLTSVVWQFMNTIPNKKLLGYSYFEQLKDILPQIILSCVMGGAVYSVSLLGLSDILTLLIQVPLGVAIYLIFSVLFKFESFEYLMSVIKQYLPQKTNKQRGV